MPPDYLDIQTKTWINDGSEIDIGTAGTVRSRATIRCLFRNCVNTTHAHLDAFQRYLEDFGTYHPVWPLLPLASIRTRRIGPDTLEVEGRYLEPSYGGGGGGTVQNPNLLANYRAGVGRSINMYRSLIDSNGAVVRDSYGFPAGKMLFVLDADIADPNIRPDYYPVFSKQIQVTIPFTANSVPTATILNLVNHVNSGNFSLGFGQPTAPPGMVRFDGADIDWYVVGNDTFFRVVYSFTVDTQYWRYMEAYYDEPTQQWKTRVNAHYPSANLNVLFQ